MYRTYHLKNKFRTVEVNYVQSRYYRYNVVTVNPGNKTIYGGLLYDVYCDATIIKILVRMQLIQ